MAGVDTVDAGGVWAGGVTDGVGDGDGVAAAGALAGGVLISGVLTGGGLAAGTVAVGAGVVAAGTVAVGAGVVAPGAVTVTVTGETPGVVVARLTAVAAPLGNGCTANTTSSATASSALSMIGRRAISGVVCPAATTRCSRGVLSRILKLMPTPFHRASCAGVVALHLDLSLF